MSTLRIVGVEDGSFIAFQPGQHTLLCAVLMVGDRIEGVRLGRVTVDGRDATEVLLRMLVHIQCDVLILGGVSFAGFNIIDASRLQGKLGIPVIVYSGEKPNSPMVLAALKAHFADWEQRWAPVTRLGDFYSFATGDNFPPIFFEVVGESREWCEAVLRSTASLMRAPEPVRVAGIIARGLTRNA